MRRRLGGEYFSGLLRLWRKPWAYDIPMSFPVLGATAKAQHFRFWSMLMSAVEGHAKLASITMARSAKSVILTSKIGMARSERTISMSTTKFPSRPLASTTRLIPFGISSRYARIVMQWSISKLHH